MSAAALPRPKRPVVIEMAVEQLLADVETFTEELSVSCKNRGSVSSDYYLRMPGRIGQADDAALLHAAMVAADRGDAETCCESMRLLTMRYLQRNDAQLVKITDDIERMSEQEQRENALGRLPRTLAEVAAC